MRVSPLSPALIGTTLAMTLVALTGCGGGSGDAGSSGGGGAAKAPGSAVATVSDDKPAGPLHSLGFSATITPKKAGTEARPQGVKLGLDLRVGQPKDAEPALLDQADVLFPQGSHYDGAAFPSCDKKTLEKADGPSGCDPASIMGTGTADVSADTASVVGRVTVVNGGKDRLYFWTELDSPVRVRTAVVGTISPADKPWGYKLHLAFPEELQVVAGVPLGVHGLKISAGKGTWLSTTECPADGWSFRGKATFSEGGSVSRDLKIDCDS